SPGTRPARRLSAPAPRNVHSPDPCESVPPAQRSPVRRGLQTVARAHFQPGKAEQCPTRADSATVARSTPCELSPSHDLRRLEGKCHAEQPETRLARSIRYSVRRCYCFVP